MFGKYQHEYIGLAPLGAALGVISPFMAIGALAGETFSGLVAGLAALVLAFLLLMIAAGVWA